LAAAGHPAAAATATALPLSAAVARHSAAAFPLSTATARHSLSRLARLLSRLAGLLSRLARLLPTLSRLLLSAALFLLVMTHVSSLNADPPDERTLHRRPQEINQLSTYPLP
jgi:hypothetical protein